MTAKRMEKFSLSHIILSAILVIAIASCSSSVTITSFPDNSEVYIRKLSDNTLKKIGETPLTIAPEDIEKENDGSGPVFLELKKDGFHPKTAIITDFNVRNIDIKMTLIPRDLLEYSHIIDSIINDLFKCQKLIKAKNYTKAATILDKIKKTHPYLSVVYEFEGGIHLVQQKFIKALDSFKMALKFNSENVEALRLKRAIEKKFNLGNKTD